MMALVYNMERWNYNSDIKAQNYRLAPLGTVKISSKSTYIFVLRKHHNNWEKHLMH